jgi:hypothetical protein
MVDAAVRAEHYCNDPVCDIAMAREWDCPFTAAYLLQSATETPLLDNVMAYVGRAYFEPKPRDWDDWVSVHKRYGRQCDSCGSYTYGDDYWQPSECGDCLVPFPNSANEDDDETEHWD